MTYGSKLSQRSRAAGPKPLHSAARMGIPYSPGRGAPGMDRVTFATSAGVVWLALAVHFAAGLVSIVAGTIALSVAKGGRLHKQSGLVFTWAMVVLGLTAAGKIGRAHV